MASSPPGRGAASTSVDGVAALQQFMSQRQASDASADDDGFHRRNGPKGPACSKSVLTYSTKSKDPVGTGGASLVNSQ